MAKTTAKVVHIHLTKELLAYVNTLVEKGEFTSVAEALRSGLRLILKEYKSVSGTHEMENSGREP